MHSSLSLLAVACVASAATTYRVSIDTSKTFQTIDGFGFSEAFQRANQIINLKEPVRSQLVDLLFNKTSGVGFTILRNGIGSSPNSTNDWMNTIEPNAPATPDSTPTYNWDGDDSGQFWIAQQAANYGVKTFYADAWSAPGFMKNNSNDAGGGYLCGSPGAPACASGDWRKAYADYLTQYVEYYKSVNISITHLGFLNEPDLVTAYASMEMTGAMAADFIKILKPALEEKGFGDQVKIACCDATGWGTQRNMSRDILADKDAAPLVDVFTTHLYTSKIDSPLPSAGQHAWMSEYADLGGNWSTNWFSANASAHNDTKAMAGDGLTWARNIHTGLTTGNLSAFLWWVATQDTATNGNNNEKLVLVDDANNTYTVAKRLWAFAQFSRAARPGAVRVGVDVAPLTSACKPAKPDDTAAATASPLRTIGFLNANGDVSTVIINDSAEDVAVDVDTGAKNAVNAEVWVTDASRDLERLPSIITLEGRVDVQKVPAHGVLSVIVRAS
ncbi:hypothetical protein SEUCBS140593_008940 [Sporothrix eucalyptigena]|uniref:Glycosyl hydrolase family 59 catalytic domain-containing protein n=1 Tax=Sporothrix eucalyptigena TaxID=1812306 RepID=A0ABP0CQT4_9PEZI